MYFDNISPVRSLQAISQCMPPEVSPVEHRPVMVRQRKSHYGNEQYRHDIVLTQDIIFDYAKSDRC